jgi:hypothetical protein
LPPINIGGASRVNTETEALVIVRNIVKLPGLLNKS